MPVVLGYIFDLSVAAYAHGRSVEVTFTHVPKPDELRDALDARLEQYRKLDRSAYSLEELEKFDEEAQACQEAYDVVEVGGSKLSDLLGDWDSTPELHNTGRANAVSVEVAGTPVGEVTIGSRPAYSRKKPTGKKNA